MDGWMYTWESSSLVGSRIGHSMGQLTLGVV